MALDNYFILVLVPDYYIDIVGHSGDVQKQLETQLWKSVVYSQLEINLGLILQEINSVLALNQIMSRHVSS